VSEEEVVKELGALINAPEPNVDAILRKIGQHNRIYGRRVKLAIMSALKQKGEKNVNALLDRNG
jgi:hypothetical protein